LEADQISPMEWYYVKDGRRFGPVPETSIRAWLESGFLKWDDLVWRSGMTDWAPVMETPELGTATRPGAPARPDAGPFGLPGGYSPPPPPGSSGYAGFLLRAGAYLLDSLLLSIVILIVWRPELDPNLDWQQMVEKLQANRSLVIGQFLLSWFYFALFESSPWQATLGKKAFRIKVTDMEGRRLNVLRTSLRHFCKVISQFTFFIGFAMAAFTPRRQALHDLLSRCLVLRS